MSKFIYTRKARITYFDGKRYDSELEASWAAFFKLRGIVYEPYPAIGLATWRPDFQINLNSSNLLVEIKPFSGLGQWKQYNDLTEKITASHADDWFTVALLGTTPTSATSFYFTRCPPDTELDPSDTEFTEEFDDIDFGDPRDIMLSWNEARNLTEYRWGNGRT